jgi:hypothetical protein
MISTTCKASLIRFIFGIIFKKSHSLGLQHILNLNPSRGFEARVWGGFISFLMVVSSVCRPNVNGINTAHLACNRTVQPLKKHFSLPATAHHPHSLYFAWRWDRDCARLESVTRSTRSKQPNILLAKGSQIMRHAFRLAVGQEAEGVDELWRGFDAGPPI